MIKRKGFVSNSSSSSFIINICYLTCKQRTFLNNFSGIETGWKIIDNYPAILGTTTMDNLGLEKFLESKGFPMEKFIFYYSNEDDVSDVYHESKKTCDCEDCKWWREMMFNET